MISLEGLTEVLPGQAHAHLSGCVTQADLCDLRASLMITDVAASSMITIRICAITALPKLHHCYMLVMCVAET